MPYIKVLFSLNHIEKAMRQENAEITTIDPFHKAIYLESQ
jgi:hypothetical protein